MEGHEAIQPQVVDNQPVESIQEPIVKGGGDMATSFDELEAVDRMQDQKIEKEAKDEAKKEEIKEKLDAKQEEPKKEEKEEKSEAKEASDKGEDEKATEEKPAKTIKAKSGDDTIDVSSDAMFKVKVDGEEKEASLRDILDGYSGQQAISKKFNELHVDRESFKKERQQFEADRGVINEQLNEIVELSKTNPDAIIDKLAGILGGSAEEMRQKLYEDIRVEFEKMQNMSEEEKRVYNAEKKADQLERRIESRETQLKNEQAQRELDDSCRKIQEEHGISDDEFESLALELTQLKQDGKITSVITPEFIAKVWKDEKITKDSQEILEELRPGLEGETKSMALNTLTSYWSSNPKASKEDVTSIAADHWGLKKARENLNRKLEKNGTTNKQDTKPLEPQNEDVFSFDQL